MKFLVASLLLAGALMVVADEPLKIWTDGKITPEQPFEAEIIGVRPGWGGDTVVLKEIVEEGKVGRYCLALLAMHHFIYRVIEKKEVDEMRGQATTFISPGVAVNQFSWSMGVHKLGRSFGEDDFVRQWYPRSKQLEKERAAAEQSAIDPSKKDD